MAGASRSPPLLPAPCLLYTSTLEGFPREADQSGTGFVYYIETSGSITWNEPLDASIYEAWRYPYVRDGQELQPEYLALTEENIQRLLLN